MYSQQFKLTDCCFVEYYDYNLKVMDIIKKIRNYTVNQRHCLGEGSFGKVYEAMSDEGRKVAIKKVDQKLIISDRYLKESLDNQIHIMQKLRHPNIVELYEVITTANNIYLVMEFCSGGDLKRYCSTRKITEEMALNIIKQITKGFEEMTRFGIIHRDLKPANILVHQEVFKICDFGFAKLFGESGRMARTFVGTPIYMSPQVLSQKHYTSKTDVWSLGVMFYELLFGKLPYSGYTEQDLFRNIMKGPLRFPECSKQSEKLLQGMLVIQEANRWSWDIVFEVLFGKSANQPRGNTPTNGGIFYANDNKKERSFDDRKLQKKDYQQHARTPPAISNNYLDNIYERQGMGHQQIRRAQQGKNMLIPQEGTGEEAVIMAKQASYEDRVPEENPRFFYFILVEFIVYPLEGSLSFDSFMFTLWKYTISLYEKLLERPEVSNIQLYKNVLSNELSQLRNLEPEFQVRKEGNLRSLAQIVFQEAKPNPLNKKRLIWLKRFIDKKYSYEAIQ